MIKKEKIWNYYMLKLFFLFPFRFIFLSIYIFTYSHRQEDTKKYIFRQKKVEHERYKWSHQSEEEKYSIQCYSWKSQTNKHEWGYKKKFFHNFFPSSSHFIRVCMRSINSPWNEHTKHLEIHKKTKAYGMELDAEKI